MCWSDRQERLRRARKWSLEQHLAGSRCNQERWNSQPEHGSKPQELRMHNRECNFFQDEHYRITAYYVNSWERTCFHMLRSPKVTAVPGTSTRRKEQLSELTDQPRHLLRGSSAPQLCSTSQRLSRSSPCSISTWLKAPDLPFSATGHKLFTESQRPWASWVCVLWTFLDLLVAVLLGWAVTAISLTDQVSTDDLFYFCLSSVEYNYRFI